MIVNREDIKVLLFGILKYCEEHWMLADLDEDEIKAEYDSIDDFDSKETAEGFISYLSDNYDCLEEIKWSVDIALDYLRMCYPKLPDQEAEIAYTGGGIFCGYGKVSDGWFGGECNGWGAVWETKGQAVESIADPEHGFVRYICDSEEQAKIWQMIYAEVIASGGEFAELCGEWLGTIDSDLESWNS